jgi:hypothetical protein
VAPKTALSVFAFYCAPGSLRAALKAGADPNERDTDTGATPLMWLCEMHDKHTRERKRMFRWLVRAGASLELTNKEGLVAWHYAAVGSCRSFRRFVRSEYKRLLGRVPSRKFKRNE